MGIRNWMNQQKRRGRYAKIRKLSKQHRPTVILSDADLGYLTLEAMDLIIARGFFTDDDYLPMHITVGIDALDGKTTEEVRRDWLEKHPEDATEEEIREQAEEEYARVRAENAEREAEKKSYEDERPDWMESKTWERAEPRNPEPDPVRHEPEPTRSTAFGSGGYDGGESSSWSSNDSDNGGSNDD